MSEWDDTPWGGTAVIEASNVSRNLGSSGTLAKAAIGWQSTYSPDRVPITELSKSPLRRMRSEQALYWSHPWVLTAENAVTRRVSGLPWHLEDESDEEVGDETPDPRLKAIRTLLEKPQATIPIKMRQVGIESWTNLISITSRHLGLCGMTHWFLDAMDGNGIPNAILYLNPARLFPHTTSSGQLVDWTLDPADDYGRGGTSLSREQVLTFYLTPPDGGAIASGMVAAAALKTRVNTFTDTHALSVLGAGGRIAGIVSPKEGTIQPDQYEVLASELRNIQEAPDSAARLAVLRGPVEFHATTATMRELDLSGLSELSRDDTFTVWGVPKSQAPAAIAAGLNSGGTKDSDEAILMQGAVHDRVRPIRETIQLGLLDRWDPLGVHPELVIEEPTFDDRTPAFELAALAKELPLTRNQRLAIIGEDPLPDYGPDGDPLGLAIDMPADYVRIGQGEEPEKAGRPGRFAQVITTSTARITRDQADAVGVLIRAGFDPAEAALALGLPPIRHVGLLPITLQSDPIEAQVVDAALASAKASTIRETITRKFEPLLRKAIAGFLSEQRSAVAARIRERGEHVSRKPSDKSVWWDAKRWDARLIDALRQGVTGLSEAAAAKVSAQVGSRAKADPFSASVALQILVAVGKRITGINDTTRDDIGKLIAEAFDRGLSPGEVATLIEDATAFNASRAELIARTETALTYNQAALSSFREYDVSRVEAIDGDDDEECAARNGQTYTVEEAMDIEDHPNGTLDWAPVFT